MITASFLSDQKRFVMEQRLFQQVYERSFKLDSLSCRLKTEEELAEKQLTQLAR